MLRSVVCLCLVIFLAAACSPKVGPGFDQPDPQAIIDHYLDKIGGKGKLKKVKTLYMAGTVDFAGAQIKLERFSECPDKMRVKLEAIRASKVRVLNGAEAFEVTQVGNIPIDGVGLQSMQLEAKVFPQLYYDNVSLKFLSRELVDGEMAYKIKLIEPDSTIRFEFYNQETGLLVKMVDAIKSKTYYRDYREVDGVLFPFDVELVGGGRGMRYFLDSLVINPSIPASTFEFNYDW